MFDRAVGRLLELRLEFQRGHRDAVDEKHEVDAPRLGLQPGGGEFGLGRPRAVDQLGHDAQAVLRVAGEGVGVQIVLGFKLAEEETRAAVAQFVAQHAERAEGAHRLVGREWIGLVELFGDALEKLLLGSGRVERAELFPLLGLGVLHEADDVLG